MTTNYESRMNKVCHSIVIWKEKYKDNFSVEYWDNLEKNYRFRSAGKHFKRLLKESKYIELANLLLKMPFNLLVLDVLHRFCSKYFISANGYFYK